MHRPSDEIGRAFSHAPDSFAEAAKRRERVTASGSCFSRVSAVAYLEPLWASQAFWQWEAGLDGGGMSRSFDRRFVASSTQGNSFN